MSQTSYVSHWLQLSANKSEVTVSEALVRHVRAKKGVDCPLYSMPGALVSLRADLIDDSVSILLAATGPLASALSISPLHIARTLIAIGALKHCTDVNGTEKLIAALTAGRPAGGVWTSVAAYLRGPATTDLAPGLLQLYLDVISDKLRSILSRKAPADSPSSQTEVLLDTISLVQRTIYTVFVVFMQQPPAAAGQGVAGTLLDRCAQEYSRAVLSRANEVAGEAVGARAPSPGVFIHAPASSSPFGLGGSGRQPSTAAASGNSNSRQQLHEMWTAWMFSGRAGEAHGSAAATASLLSSACMACLRALKSSADVTALQHRVRTACAVIPFSGTNNNNNNNSGGDGGSAADVKATWGDANRLLVLKLGSSRQLSAAAVAELETAVRGGAGCSSSADLLWSRVFRLPFLRQVKRRIDRVFCCPVLMRVCVFMRILTAAVCAGGERSV
jgi:hypothetical protein